MTLHQITQRQTTPTMPQAERLRRRILAIASWAILALVIVGLVATIPEVDSTILAAPPGSLLEIAGKGIAMLGGISLLLAWAAALWDAIENPHFRSEGQKVAIVMALAVGNAIAAFFYYFTYVVWLAEADSSEQVAAHAQLVSGLQPTPSASQAVARRILAITSVLMPIDVVLAVLSPYGPDGRLTGPIGYTANVLAFVSIFGAWIAGIWHAAVARPWRPAAPRWVMLLLLAFGVGVGGFLYYWLCVRWQTETLKA
jgi:hypothetical protein